MSGAPLHPILLAGGRGTRFWPLSRRARPKPFLSLGGGPSLLQRTWSRARGLAPADRIHVALESRLAPAASRELPELPADNLILEPEARDTGPAAVHAAWSVERRTPGGLLALLPADHVVEDVGRFGEAMAVATEIAAREGALVCLGIPPTGPATGFGYLECAGSAPGHAVSARVGRFVEKPDRDAARRLLEGGRVLWNSGIFVGLGRTFLEETMRVAPELRGPLECLERDGDVHRFFREAPRIALDRAVMERSDRVWVVGTEMGWDDLGTWEALRRHLPRDSRENAGTGTRVSLDARGCLVHSPGKPVVLVGVEDLVIVECDDVVLVAHRSCAERLREVPDLLEEQGLADRT